MIGYLRGLVMQVSEASTLVDVGGVGYEVSCSQNTLGDLPMDGETALWIYTHVREDALILFGFSSQVEKCLFESLIKVNGIGPKMAITILSGAQLDSIIDYIENDDVKGLTSLPKVGKKTAEQMILTLKGKLVLEKEEGASKEGHDLSSALSHLGFKSAEIKEVSQKISTELDFEERVREALKMLRGGM